MCEPNEVFLNPGDVHFAASACRIRTLLGSCVAITLWHPWLHLGGMCHYMLPTRAGPPTGELDGRYADEAVELLRTELERYATEPAEYEAKLFGAGSQFATAAADPFDVPRNNIVAGRRLLDEYGFLVVAADLGGAGARRLAFDTSTGAVRVSRAGPACFPDAV